MRKTNVRNAQDQCKKYAKLKNMAKSNIRNMQDSKIWQSPT